jgi:ankyrin repeat protein
MVKYYINTGTSLFHLISISPKKYDVEIAEILLKNGCEINSLDKYLNSPLITAITENNISLVEFFLKNNSNVMIRNKKNNNILHELFGLIKFYDIEKLYNLIFEFVEKNDKNFQTLLKQTNNKGRTPILELFFNLKISIDDDEEKQLEDIESTFLKANLFNFDEKELIFKKNFKGKYYI